ncbi:GntR family transcriptional regulator [Oceaniglobus trochenteri]|uniref:GntR family transcriptional regulator n=1 Tax=Oceaniglobus trochenteri TaxID=2763260 RepID=UPI001D0018C6|nr:GntR family transcriptional regulator [Oceaniglobus trochenteri]
MNPDPFIRSGGAPLYRQLADLLRARIAAGDWREGDFLPPIEQLMDDFHVSRVTVRDAIKLLSRDGLVSPQRGRGTIVKGSIATRPLRVEGSLHDLIETYRGDIPDISNLQEGFAQPDLNPDEAGAAEAYFHMRRVHTRDGVPYCQIDLFIEKGIYDQAPERFRKQLVLPLLIELEVPIVDGRQSVTIGKCTAELAGLLSYEMGDPVANVRRTLIGPDGRAVYFAKVTYRGDCIRFDMNMRP